MKGAVTARNEFTQEQRDCSDFHLPLKVDSVLIAIAAVGRWSRNLGSDA